MTEKLTYLDKNFCQKLFSSYSMVEVVTKIRVIAEREKNLSLKIDEKFLLMRENEPGCYIIMNKKVIIKCV